MRYPWLTFYSKTSTPLPTAFKSINPVIKIRFFINTFANYIARGYTEHNK